MRLDLRLSAIADMVEKCGVLADIGTDHGKLPVYLMQKHVINHAIAADISKKSLDKAKQLASIYKLDIETRLGDGLDVLKQSEADYIVIAGMGGMLIADILDKNKETASASTLVLQPMKDDKLLRKYLMNNSFEIIDENIAKEKGKIYPIIKAHYNIYFHGNIEHDINEIIYEIGPVLIQKRPLFFNEYILKKIETYEIKIKYKYTDKLSAYIENLKTYLKK